MATDYRRTVRVVNEVPLPTSNCDGCPALHKGKENSGPF